MKKAILMMMSALQAMSVTACGAGTSNSSSGNRAPAGPNSTPEHKEVIEPPSTTEEKTVVFSTFFPSDYFKEAKKKYEAKHPNITIELNSIATDDEK
ncbi:hypothetical protein P4H83_18590 [Paenibacillus favisporus]|uniref:hypothetical protein n=1 Tax=Paenibacillus favisporus TaxID=221028 RepID=UPI002DBB2A97|nr:hypothetical protein [Paenibacillus favisporus]MEC0176887.1 hypothetical protein [Paenibacillus favisporus]